MKTQYSRIILLCLALLRTTSTASAQEYFGGNYCQPCFPDIGRFSAGADWLYWKATEDGLNFGLLDTETLVGTTLETTQHIIKPKFEYDSGYRVYAGYEVPCYDWELGVIYTHAPNTRADTTAISVSDVATGVAQASTILTTSLFNFEPIIPDTISGQSIAARWGLDFDYIDFDLAHTLCISDYLGVRPHIGIRYLWAKQSFNLDFAGSSIGPIGTTDTFLTGFFNNNTQGVGVEGGLWGDWEIAYGVSILGHVGGSVLYGQHKVRGTKVRTEIREGATTADTFTFHDFEHTSIPMLDYFIGIQYVTTFMNFEANFHLGWEQHVVFDMNRFTTTDGGDLALQGLTLGGGFAF